MSVFQKLTGTWRRLALIMGGWLVCEVVTRVAVPMPDARVLSGYFGRGGLGLLGLYDMMVGGALSSGSVLALGIMPYLSARIFRALGGIVSPTIARLEHSAEGRRTLGRWTMRLTAVLSVIQAYGFARFTQNLPGVVAQPGVAYVMQTVVVLSAAATFMGWLCAQATDDASDVEQTAPGLLGEAAPDINLNMAKRVTTPLPSISGGRRLLLLFAFFVAASASAQAGSAQRPNVVLIITDDVGYGDFGSYGAPDVKTPNIDRLARDGVRLTDFYANGPTCTPTRAGLISGRYQQRFGLELPLGARHPADDERGLLPTGTSLPQLLKNSGYATALIGKWHLGWKPEYSPNAHGFEYFFGFKSGFIDYWQHTPGADSPLATDLFENDKQVEVPGYMTDLITERSIRFIGQNTKRPFFIDVAYNAAHYPYQRPDHPSVARDKGKHLTPFDDSTSTRADYVAVLERADQGVGRILRALDSLGLRENTIVIFTNDNGGEWLSRNTPFFHNKGTVWEGGIRVPAIVRWPGHIPAGRVSGQVGITMDLTASILAATRTPVPADARPEGIDLMAVFEGRTPEIQRTLFWRAGGVAPGRAVRSGDWKLIFDGPRAMLFNVRTDLSERTNVIAEHTDIARRLGPLLSAWQKDVDDEAKRAAAR